MRYDSVVSGMAGAWVATVVFLAGITVNLQHYQSSAYRYSIGQPTSYRHQVIQNIAHQKVDYFFPSLGSYVTNVNIYSDHASTNTAAHLRDMNGKKVRQTGTVRIMGTTRKLYGADFKVLGDPYTLEQVCFTASRQTWHLTMSYSWQFRSQRPLMLRMLRTFQAE